MSSGDEADKTERRIPLSIRCETEDSERPSQALVKLESVAVDEESIVTDE